MHAFKLSLFLSLYHLIHFELFALSSCIFEELPRCYIKTTLKQPHDNFLKGNNSICYSNRQTTFDWMSYFEARFCDTSWYYHRTGHGGYWQITVMDIIIGGYCRMYYYRCIPLYRLFKGPVCDDGLSADISHNPNSYLSWI